MENCDTRCRRIIISTFPSNDHVHVIRNEWCFWGAENIAPLALLCVDILTLALRSYKYSVKVKKFSNFIFNSTTHIELENKFSLSRELSHVSVKILIKILFRIHNYHRTSVEGVWKLVEQNDYDENVNKFSRKNKMKVFLSFSSLQILSLYSIFGVCVLRATAFPSLSLLCLFLHILFRTKQKIFCYINFNWGFNSKIFLGFSFFSLRE